MVSLSTLHIDVRFLVDRLRNRRSRADELRALRTRLVEATPLSRLSKREQQLAEEMKGLRHRILRAIGPVHACSSCSTGSLLPPGRWDGGFCCAGNTEDIFSDEELAALQATGTRASDLKGPRSDHAGCAFRGSRGCTLAVEHRPNICVAHICNDLARELAKRGDFETIDRLSEQLKASFAEFNEHRTRRVDAEWLARLWTE